MSSDAKWGSVLLRTVGFVHTTVLLKEQLLLSWLTSVPGKYPVPTWFSIYLSAISLFHKRYVFNCKNTTGTMISQGMYWFKSSSSRVAVLIDESGFFAGGG